MAMPQEMTVKRDRGFAMRSTALFGLFYLHLWLRVDPRLIYHSQEPVFSRGWGFFAFYGTYPGGVVEYLSALLSQSLYYPWLGALVVTAVVWLICVCTRAVLVTVGEGRGRVISLAPAIPLVVLHNRYEYALSHDLGLLSALLGLVVYSRITALRPCFRLLVFSGLSILLYWVGGGPYLLFALLAAILELSGRRHVPLGLCCVVAGLVLPYLAAVWVFPLKVGEAYGRGLLFLADHLRGDLVGLAAAVALYLLLPVAMLALTWRRGSESSPGTQSQRPASVSGLSGGRLGWSAGTLALLVVAAIPAFSTLDENQRALLEVDYRARHGEWGQVLEATRHLKGYNVLAVYDIQRALAHLGRLGEDMLSFPHLAGQPIFSPSPETPHLLVALCDVLLDVGHVNKAEHMAHEALEIHGPRASILQRLVLINVLKGRVNAARVLLGRLEQTLLHRDWAREYGRALDADPELATDPRLAAIRPLMLQTDYPGFFPPDILLRQLLDHNGRNALSLELLMAHYLQTRQLGAFVESMRRLRGLPESRRGTPLPRHYSEAVLLYLMQGRLQTGSMPDVPLYGRRMGSQTELRFGEFSRILASHKTDREAARAALAATYRNTYWFYYLFSGPQPGGGRR